METVPGVPTGVQALIDRLRDEGVKAGREESERLQQEAREEAERIVARARKEAEQLRTRAESDIRAERRAAEEAIRISFRDTELKIKSELKGAFEEHVRRLVTTELKNTELLRQLILQIAGRAAALLPEGRPLEITVGGAGHGTAGGVTAQEGEELAELVMGISRDMLDEGVELKVSGRESDTGIRIKLKGEDLEIDLSDRALTELLLRFLAPRYRSIVQGVE